MTGVFIRKGDTDRRGEGIMEVEAGMGVIELQVGQSPGWRGTDNPSEAPEGNNAANTWILNFWLPRL